MLRSTSLFVLLAALLSLLSGCDTQCVGPNCETPVDDDDDAVADDDDAVADDDDDATDPVDTEDPEIVEQRSCDATIHYTPLAPVGSVQVAGEFNGWTPQDMTDDGYGSWSFVVDDLAPGHHGYKFLPDGQWEGDPPPWAWAKWVDGSENRNLIHGDCNVPLLQSVSATATADSVQFVVQFARAADGAAVDPGAITATVGGQVVTPTVDAETGRITISASGLASGKHSLRLWASDTSGREVENQPLFVPLWVQDEPWEWDDGLMYFVFTDRFRNGDFGEAPLYPAIENVEDRANYNGGDFLGVLQAIEEGYFEEMGVDVLWLTPVYDNPEGAYLATDGFHNFTGFHGYWPIDPLAVENRLGDTGSDAEARLHELIEAAHARGIRVLFDTVLNHVHQDHIYTQEHPEWFGGGCVCGTDGCGWEERTLDCWFTDYLPDLNYRNHWIVDRVLQDTLTLVERFDVDGLRVDAAKHMDHVIMRGLNKAVRTHVEAGGGAEFYLVGETFTGGDGHGTIMNYVNDWELHGQFDFPLYWAIRSAFAHGGGFDALDGMVRTGENSYGDGLMSPFLGNHDIERFATEATGTSDGAWGWSPDWMADGGDQVTQWDLINKMSMGFAFTLTQPGVPLIYYGDEIGLAGAGDPDNRRFMSFEPFLSANQRELRDRVAAIGQARKGSAALRRGERTTLWVDGDLYVYALKLGGDVAIVAMNKGGTQRVQQINVGDLDIDGMTLTDAIHPDRQVGVDGDQIEVALGSWQYAILVP